jgi:hypothetical protein
VVTIRSLKYLEITVIKAFVDLVVDGTIDTSEFSSILWTFENKYYSL